MNQKGVTLIELLIAVTCAVIVAAGGYSFFVKEFNFSVMQSRSTQMQEDSRAGFEIMTREIRAAGFGLIEPLTGTLQPSAPAPLVAGDNVNPDPNGVANRTDQITVSGGYLAIGSLSAAAASSATQITVSALPGLDPTLPLVGQYITIEGFYYGQVTARSANGSNPLTLTLSTPLNRAYSTLDNVFVMQTITYSIGVPAAGAEPVLYRNANDGISNQKQVIASGIEDLQISYLMSDGTEIDNPPAVVLPAAGLEIVSVRVFLLARAKDPSTTATTSIRPTIRNHAGAAARDHYHRRLISKAVEVRNLGFF